MTITIWSILASIGSFVGMLITLILAIRSSARTRQQELQDFKDEMRKRQDEFSKDDRDRQKAIYDELNRRIKEIENVFVRKDMCDILHGTLKEGIDGMRKDVRRINETDGD